MPNMGPRRLQAGPNRGAEGNGRQRRRRRVEVLGFGIGGNALAGFRGNPMGINLSPNDFGFGKVDGPPGAFFFDQNGGPSNNRPDDADEESRPPRKWAFPADWARG